VEDVAGGVDIDALDELMPARSNFDDENREISEWKITRFSISDFSNRLKTKLKL
jgi:triacylglycerol esterase/lipase EstA (alpha/beta hydrolase family)